MEQQRIHEHPVLDVPVKEDVKFYWNNESLTAKVGEVISSALMANGIKTFGHHHKDGTAQGIFCANGQCAKCTVIANGIPVKSCMTVVQENMIVKPAEGLPEMPISEERPNLSPVEQLTAEVLIIGGGPAGLSAAIELGKRNIKTLIIDDKNELGGKLVLQTHKFFGSVEDSHAGTRGNDIGKLLAKEVGELDAVDVWLNSTAIYVFSDKKVGILKDGVYKIVEPKLILNAAGAREKYLRFNGNTLTGIYGAGAFQTLVNRDLVKPTERLFIIGGGNVGLIAGYHALQAGIEVVGLVEAMPKCGGYKVHDDKLRRLGVPIYTSHSILSANGEEEVSSITITEIDAKFEPVKGTEQTFECDTILIAVGLDRLDEFTREAEIAGINVFAAGDAHEIAEASSAMFNGKIAGIEICKAMGAEIGEIPTDWVEKAKVLKSHPGAMKPYTNFEKNEGVFPIIHCLQEIPCNPCTTVCPTNSIHTEDGGLMGVPIYDGSCIGCGKCVLICPGLAITLVDYRKNQDNPIVTMPYEVGNYPVKEGDKLQLMDIDGVFLEEGTVTQVLTNKANRTQLVRASVSSANVRKVASFKIQDDAVSAPITKPIIDPRQPDEAMICLCERVTVGEVRTLIKQGITDLNQIKAITRAGMGPCGAKTCDTMVKQVLRQEGVPVESVVPNTKRPVFIEVPLEFFADGKE